MISCNRHLFDFMELFYANVKLGFPNEKENEPSIWPRSGCVSGQGDHFLNGEAKFETMQGIADTDFTLDLLFREASHDCTRFHIGPTGRHVPSRHSDPELQSSKVFG